jgi:hypothetical protein
MNIKHIQKIAAQVQKNLFREASSASMGFFKSQFRGTGLQFREHQVYEPGDDVRFIDWKMSAKMSRTYIKTFEEERNVEVVVIIDLSPSLHMGEGLVSKLQAAAEIAILLALIAEKTKDKVKCHFLGTPSLDVQALQGRAFVAHFLSQLEKKQMLGKRTLIDRNVELIPATLEQKLKVLKQYASKRKHVIYISDSVLEEMKDLKSALSQKWIHPVKLVTELDLATTQPFSFPSSTGNGSGYEYSVVLKSNEEPLIHHPKVIQLKMHENYLEKFIEKMRRS